MRVFSEAIISIANLHRLIPAREELEQNKLFQLELQSLRQGLKQLELDVLPRAQAQQLIGLLGALFLSAKTASHSASAMELFVDEALRLASLLDKSPSLTGFIFGALKTIEVTNQFEEMRSKESGSSLANDDQNDWSMLEF